MFFVIVGMIICRGGAENAEKTVFPLIPKDCHVNDCLLWANAWGCEHCELLQARVRGLGELCKTTHTGTGETMRGERREGFQRTASALARDALAGVRGRL